MRPKASPSQRLVNHARTRMRRDMENLAKSHRGCTVARGCGCLVDQALVVLETTEHQLFLLELNSYADPTTERRAHYAADVKPVDGGHGEDEDTAH